MKKYLYYFTVFCLTMCYGCKQTKSSRISDTKAIDKVTPELAKAVSNYDKVSNFHEGLASFQKAGKYGYINKVGEEIISCSFDKAYDFYNGFAVVGKRIGNDNIQYGCINQEGKMIIQQIYDEINGFRFGEISPARYNGYAGAINKNGETVIKFEYKAVYGFSEGMAAVIDSEDKMGFIDTNGKIVIPFKYKETPNSYFSEGLVSVENDEGNCGFLDKNGRIAIPFVYAWAKPFHCGYAAVGYDCIFGNDGSFSCKDSYINKSGDIVMNPIINGECDDFSDNGYARIHIDYKGYGIIDKQFNVILPFEFEVVNPTIGATELISVEYEKNKWGIYDASARKFLIPCEYELIGDGFYEGYISVMKNDKIGYLDKKGKVVIPFCYDSGSDFSEGFAVVERYGKYGYVDRYGNDTFSIK